MSKEAILIILQDNKKRSFKPKDLLGKVNINIFTIYSNIRRLERDGDIRIDRTLSGRIKGIKIK